MTSEGFDLDAYLIRIGYAGPREPTLATLRELHLLHPQAIPFENLDPLLRRAPPLDIASLQNKLVRSGRGGYCYEHNLLFMRALQTLGFQVTGLAARVMWNAPEGAVRPRTHMLLRIDLDGAIQIADVGFGGQTLTAPLALAVEVEQETPHGTFRLTRQDPAGGAAGRESGGGTVAGGGQSAGADLTGPEFIAEALVGGAWKPLYRFDLQPQLVADYELASWYLSNHPQSPFVNNLMVARVGVHRRYGLMNNRLSVHPTGGASEHHLLTSAAEIRSTLESTFGIRLPLEADLQAVLSRFV